MSNLAIFIAVFAAAFIFISPLLIMFLNTFKPLNEIVAFPLRLPSEWSLSNYAAAWEKLDMLNTMKNTVFISIFAVSGIIILAAMTAYWSERHPTIFSGIFSRAIQFSVLIPFATIMIPLVKVMKFLHINNTIPSVVLTYWGIGLAFAFFLFQSGVKSLPVELEEAARIDGCGHV
ncbi:carbohydrate ABC transporter permease [Paenibacillus albidus]|nr:ABC transporter permease subunit [Paenibacillus albidus]MBT2290161.1 carbohydrate ABC transporter permease [Paenibacillus albidus]